MRGAERRAALDAQFQLTQTRDPEELEALAREITRLRPKTVESLHLWSADVSSTIDELERLDRGDGILAGRLDLDRISAMGHSFGGAAAGQACLDDPRCKGGVNLDGFQIGNMLEEKLTCPFLFVHHDNSSPNPAPNRLFFERSDAPAYLMTVRGTGHLAFTDVALYGRTSLFRLAAPVGRMDGRRCQEITTECVRAFLDVYLRGKDASLLGEKGRKYPEVELQAPGERRR